jgi:hypothetical protein
MGAPKNARAAPLAKATVERGRLAEIDAEVRAALSEMGNGDG